MRELAGLGVPFGGYANGFSISGAALQPGAAVVALEARMDLAPSYAERALKWVERGASVVGECCEVGLAHIAALAERLTSSGCVLVPS